MKKILFIILALISATVMTTAQNNSENVGPVMIENRSQFDFSATIDSLSKIITDNSWKITVIHDLQETMKKNGKEVLPVKVLEICNPVLAFQILSRDDLRDVTPMLPCRISVYEKADGMTYISRMNAPAFAAMIGGDASKTIYDAFSEVEEFITLVAEN